VQTADHFLKFKVGSRAPTVLWWLHQHIRCVPG